MLEPARFEWCDSSGLASPSLVCVACLVNDSVPVKSMPILHTRKILSFDEMYTRKGALDKRKLPCIANYCPQWSVTFFENVEQHGEGAWYALVVGYVSMEE